ncbi:unnamed protein product, partial [Didymodactylos carnosus]
MASILKLQVISGAYNEGPLAYLLQTDDYRFLLDCGWDENFSQEIIDEYKRHIKSIDAVLITYPDLYHLGALPYLVGHCGLKCPIYATVPVYKMGQMFMYDLHQSRLNNEDFNLFTLDHIDAAFDQFITLKYDQSVALEGNGNGLVITPLPAGHMIGGTIWKITKEGEEEIVYAVDYNHKKERHLNSSNMAKINRPTLLITDALNTISQGQRKTKDALLLTTILETMRRDGNVLICVDTAGRVLELALLLEQLWRNEASGLFAYSLALLNNFSFQVIEFARSQVEWMSDKIQRQFEELRANPFNLRFVKLCHSLSDLSKVPAPKVVLASQPDLECGFARDLFIDWCQNEKNSIILTTRTSVGTLARELIDNPDLKTIEVEVRRKVRLEGVELEEHLQRQRELNSQKSGDSTLNNLTLKKQLSNSKKRAIKNRTSIDQMEISDDENEDDENLDDEDDEENRKMIDTGTVSTPTVPLSGLILTNTDEQTPQPQTPLIITNPMQKEQQQRGSNTQAIFAPKRKNFPMFPYKEEKFVCDDYGEIVSVDDYMIVDVKHPIPNETNYGDSDERRGDASTTNNDQFADITNEQYITGPIKVQQHQLNDHPHHLSTQQQHVPYKTVCEKRKLELNSKILYVDFEARSDRESIEKLLNSIKPKNLILIHGTQECVEQLEKYCLTKQIVQGRIFSPRVKEIVDATTERNLYQ